MMEYTVMTVDLITGTVEGPYVISALTVTSGPIMTSLCTKME